MKTAAALRVMLWLETEYFVFDDNVANVGATINAELGRMLARNIDAVCTGEDFMHACPVLWACVSVFLKRLGTLEKLCRRVPSAWVHEVFDSIKTGNCWEGTLTKDPLARVQWETVVLLWQKGKDPNVHVTPPEIVLQPDKLTELRHHRHSDGHEQPQAASNAQSLAHSRFRPVERRNVMYQF
ncbi:hypothetical protein JCM10212_001640 [Sporobolomyces blumeae]